MLYLCLSLTMIAVAVLVLYVYEKCKAYSVKSLLLKFIVSALFIAIAIAASYKRSGRILNPFIIVGLLLGLSGDIWLDLKYIYPKDDKIYTYAGFLVFGLGHIFFITGMFLQYLGDASFLYILIPILGAVIVAFGNLFLAKPLKIEFKDMKWVAFSYSITLFALPLCSLSLLILDNWSSVSLRLLFVGGLLFAISDLVLSNTYFKEGHEKPIDFIFNYLFYYGAQFTIAFSLLYI